MKVIKCEAKLLKSTENALDLLCLAGKRCTVGSTDILDLKNEVEKMSKEEMIKYVNKIVSSGHLSVLEHIQYSFHVVCSRQCSHQLVRHRLASYSQLSQRYTESNELYFIKEAVKDIDEKYLEQIEKIYNEQKALNKSIKKEDSRSLLPNGVATALIVTMNGRELLHFMNERLCSRAQEEIRILANQMVGYVDDFLKDYCKPKCISGYCSEFKSGCALGKALGLIS